MTILANAILERTVKAYDALLAHPELRPFMRPELLEALTAQAHALRPLLAQAGGASEADDARVADVDAVYAATRDLCAWIHDGARFRYRKHPAELARLAPLRLGQDPAEDGVRLATLQRVLPELEPAFPWQPDDGLTAAALGKQLKAHRAAQEIEPTLGVTEKAALGQLRAARPASQALWSDEGGRLEAWIIANVPPADHYAFGRERRQRPRAQKAAPQKDVPSPPAGQAVSANHGA